MTMQRDISIHCLSTHPDAVRIVAGWYYDEWVHKNPATTIENVVSHVSQSLDTRDLPLTFVAYIKGALAGAAQLKIREMRKYSDFEYWLGGVYVDPQWRGKSVASQLVSHCLSEAERRAIGDLYLQTHRMDGGLYQRLGWEPELWTTRANDRILVMKKRLV